MVATVFLVVHVDVKASAERKAQAGSGGLWRGGGEAATAAAVKPVGKQPGINTDGPADGLNLWCL